MNFLFDSKAMKGLSTAIVAAGALVMPTEAFATDWVGNDPSSLNGKNVYLYNVGTKSFLGKGGRWGTEADVSYEGTLFTLNYNSSAKTFTLQSHVKGEGTASNGYLTIMDGLNSQYDKLNFFIDRPSLESANQGITATAVSSASEDNEFKIYNFTFTPKYSYKDGNKTYKSEYYGNTYYLTAAANNSVSATASTDNENSQWIIVSEDDRRKAFQEAEVAYAAPVNATFLMYNFDFARNDNSCSNWKTSTGTLSFSGDTVCKPSTQTATYYIGNGYDGQDYTTDPITGEKLSTKHNLQQEYGGKWTANIHGVSGKVYQSIDKSDMLKNGYYTISCKAFTTATMGKVRLWAAASSNDGDGSSDTKSKAYDYEKVTAITDAPTTYVGASNLLSAEGTTYDASVRVYVSDYTKQQLTFGIYVDGADESAWTCFDDFAIQYAGDPKHNLVLDEDQTSGDYIKDQATPDDETLSTSTLYLHRTMNDGKWNTLVLPVDITVGNAKSAFGDNVRISEFKGAIDENRPQTIVFEKVNVNRDQSAEIAMKAGKLYLVKVDEGKTMPTDQDEVTVEGYDNIKLTSYYTFPGITFKQAKDVEKTDFSARVGEETGKEDYAGNGSVKFVGTYVKLTDKNMIPADSYVLSGKNTENGSVAGLWYYRTVQTKSNGFRGWLEASDTSASSKLTYIIDGVEETAEGATNSIAEAFAGEEKAISGNIYSISGQLVRQNATSVEGLPAGIYVNNGMKIVVK